MHILQQKITPRNQLTVNKEYKKNVNEVVENNIDEEDYLLTAFLRLDIMEEVQANVHTRIEN